MVRMNIVLSEPLAEHLKTVPNKSRFIAEALEEKIARARAKVLKAELAEAYAAGAEEDLAECREWDATLLDGLEDAP